MACSVALNLGLNVSTKCVWTASVAACRHPSPGMPIWWSSTCVVRLVATLLPLVDQLLSCSGRRSNVDSCLLMVGQLMENLVRDCWMSQIMSAQLAQ